MHDCYKFARKNNIYTFCKPFLEATKLNGLEFCRIYNDTSRINLSTSPAWLEFFYTHKLYLTAKLQRHPDCYQSGAYLWLHWDKSCISYQQCGKLAEDYFNFSNGISIIRKNAAYCDIFQLVASKENLAANEFYIHNLDLINKYINYFLSDPIGLIVNAQKQPFYLTYPAEFNIHSEYHDLLNALLTTNFIPKSNLRLTMDQLTTREKQCIYWLANGLAVPTIAERLQLSSRTVEKYVVSLKNKLACSNLFQLGSISNKLQATLRLGVFLDEISS